MKPIIDISYWQAPGKFRLQQIKIIAHLQTYQPQLQGMQK